ALDLFEIQDLAALDEFHVCLRHAVKAPDIAAVRDADPQVVVNPAKTIDQHGSYFTANMRSSGSTARRMMSSGSSTRGSTRSRQSRSLSSVLSFMYGHSLQLQFSFATK